MALALWGRSRISFTGSLISIKELGHKESKYDSNQSDLFSFYPSVVVLHLDFRIEWVSMSTPARLKVTFLRCFPRRLIPQTINDSVDSFHIGGINGTLRSKFLRQCSHCNIETGLEITYLA